MRKAWREVGIPSSLFAARRLLGCRDALEHFMTQTDATLTATASVLGITIDPAWVATVRFHYDLSLRQAHLVASFPLPDDAEPAPVFTA